MKGASTIEVHFHPLNTFQDELITFVVIMARHQGKWLFVRHRGRTTWEIPGGHREPGEDPDAAARRELNEETGATDFSLVPICAYSVSDGDRQSYGRLFHAEVDMIGPLPESEIGEVILADAMPAELTYPLIQPAIFRKVKEYLGEG